ncbi:MAG: glucoamylase family protein [Woeseia sp.]
MGVSLRTRGLFYRRWIGRGRSVNAKPAIIGAKGAPDAPLRAELFSADQMEQHGARLASVHQVSTERLPERLLSRLADNESVLLTTCRTLTAAVAVHHRITPAGEWLLDNLYLVEEQIRTARRHLPKGYSRELPSLVDGPSAGLPRVYDIALEAIAHGDGRVDPDSLGRFVAAYQAGATLRLGELWAIPIMLRLALIENLRRVAMRIADGRVDQELALDWSDKLMDMARSDPKNLILVIADMARSGPPMSTPFVSELTRQLQGHGPALALPLTWIEQRLAESGQNIEQLVRAGNQQQAADQVSVSNSIGSLRAIGTIDWQEFVESLSLVEKELGKDPAGTYPFMDFSSRDGYRHVVENVARTGDLGEVDVARSAVELARAGAGRCGAADRTAHVGYYLVDRGLSDLEQSARVSRSLAAALWRWPGKHPVTVYLGSILLITVLLSGGLLYRSWADGVDAWALPVLGLLFLLVAGQLAVSTVNWLATLLATPRPLSRMDFSKGIPPASRALVVIPTLFTSTDDVDKLVDALEVRYLANREPNLHFGLLTDFRDAREETLPGDAPLLAHARQRIEGLNSHYAANGHDVFFLFHRPRRWNAHDKIWMGHERKRGKLADLNLLLREGNSKGFSLVVGTTAVLANVRYVITIDTDTQLPRDAARQFVATMAHPLNRPVYDSDLGRVMSGYGILQPRVSTSLPDGSPTRYARVFGGDTGIDPYTRVVSDVYQDVFGEGSFIGKGIYDVDAFERALKDRFPENRILSHDLLEGCYARAGLLSDVQLYEEHPVSYADDVARRHRWIRGDWQVAAWLLPWVPGSGCQLQKNPLSAHSRWKLLDNLRRSLVPAALTLLLLLGWAVLPSTWLWTLVVLGVVLIPSLLALLHELVQKPNTMRLGQHLRATAIAARSRLAQAGLYLTTLPYEAYYSLDAILRTLVRLLVTRRRLLSWNPSGDRERLKRHGIAASFGIMWFAPVLAIATTVWLAYENPRALLAAGPLLVLWLASPAVTWWLSRPMHRREALPTAGQQRFLARIARKTWAFFEDCVGADDNWLPPDNYQQDRDPVLAHRTSPTNIGMALLANLAAWDFGYIPAGTLIARSSRTFESMSRLERYRGHFYNWYDTQSLQPLTPIYVSTVDSGNLAGHLLTLRPGLLELIDAPVLDTRWLDGLNDTADVLAQVRRADTSGAMARFQDAVAAALEAPPTGVTAWRALLLQLVPFAEALGETAVAESEAAWWAQTLRRQVGTLLDELSFLVPWAAVEEEPALAALNGVPTLRELSVLDENPAGVAVLHDGSADQQVSTQAQVRLGAGRARERIADLQRLARTCDEFSSMEFGFLYDPKARLLSIGYSVDERRRDTGRYDLLASEARLGVFVAIAQRQLPQESWFALGRLLTTAGGAPVLLSWSGSMFEYLMPQLVMPVYEDTLLDQTSRAVVARQIEHGQQHDVPWGMSESGYSTRDLNLNYQYRAFGVPALGLKRGLDQDLVIAPYAAAMALMVAPAEACRNLQRLSAAGAEGRYGFYEALDFTPSRQRRGDDFVLVRSYMAHHQGMSLLALLSRLRNRPMQRRFMADPLLRATLLLLQERIPRASAIYAHLEAASNVESEERAMHTPIRVISDLATPVPEVQLLSNGRYHVMVTQAGGGYSRLNELALTRWREDVTRDHWGTFCYLQEAGKNGAVWSSAHQPTLKKAGAYEAIFSEGRAEFRRRDGNFETHTEIVISPEDDIELRRVRITNRSTQSQKITLTSYAEVVLAPPDADAQHPAFSNLFVQTEIVGSHRAILCSRRPRSRDESVPLMFHGLAVHNARFGDVSYETDRSRFIGRGRSAASPLALDDAAPLSGTEGAVLDPVVAIRCPIVLEADQSVTVDLVFGVAPSRDAALALVDKYQDRHLADRVFELAWTHAQVVLRQINASDAEAQLYGRLANSILYAHGSLRADSEMLLQNRRGQSGLWGYAISGDLPIVLVRIGDMANIELVRQLIQAHAYWRLKGLAVDLVIWNEDRAGYRQELHERIHDLVAIGLETQTFDRSGGIFVRSAEQVSEEDRILFASVARIILSDRHGLLAEQVIRTVAPKLRVKPFKPARPNDDSTPAALPSRELILSNGTGGFTPDGREYVITTTADQLTPAPWVNVLANPQFGSVISESGQSYTWGENAHEFRLTPWHNDPVGDPSGEAFYLRDEESGQSWSPTPLPRRGTSPYVSRHGFGYSVFEHTEAGIASELLIYVAHDAAVKYSVIRMRNVSGRTRRLSAIGYVEWVLGDLRPRSAMHVVTQVDPSSGALYARAHYNTGFSGRVAFFDADEVNRTFTCDRTEFIGRNGNLSNPAALGRKHLSGRVGAGLDPCAAIQVPFELAAGEEREIIFRLGLGGIPGGGDVSHLVQRSRSAEGARRVLQAVSGHWNKILGAVQVCTPDKSVNVLCNGWLIYQVIASRLEGRSGYYQSGGAIGFRDQLQDVMALVHTEPELLRDQLLLCASRQFEAGDVQHWWHPPSGRGVRTRCSDDYLWLPLATSRYVMTTGDTGVLDERVAFLEGRPLNPEEDSYYDLPERSAVDDTLYGHCLQALRHGLRFGEHGLPLIGSGDWNDGMDRVGREGRGESVWLGFFLYDVLQGFGALARARGDETVVMLCASEAEQLRENLERHGWDGGWYRRAYFDDGTPLGSAANAECRIDSISQSWAVLSGAGSAERVRMAMSAVNELLVRRDHALIQLLDPPFDTSEVDPGYIKGYVPGVRENGGQYTHAAVWTTMAFAALGDCERAWELASMINPGNHAKSAADVAIYKVEPYVMAADVYAVEPHAGRGGWTWYTGSAGWMYRLYLESLLGLRLEVDRLHLAPCLPAHWERLTIRYRYRQTVYHIEVLQAGGGAERRAGRLTVDGVEQAGAGITLVDDQREHSVQLRV